MHGLQQQKRSYLRDPGVHSQTEVKPYRTIRAIRDGKDIIQEVIKDRKIQIHDKAVGKHLRSLKQPIGETVIGYGDIKDTPRYEGR